MFNKRFLICWLTATMTLTALGFIAFALVLDEYLVGKIGSAIWRNHDNVKLGWLLFGNIVTAFAIVKIYIFSTPKNNLVEGVKFGLNIGILWGTVELINHAKYVTSVELMFGSFIGDVFLFTITAIVLSKIYDACTY